MRPRPHEDAHIGYVRAVRLLSSFGKRAGMRPGTVQKGLSDELALSGLGLDAACVSLAAKSAALLSFVGASGPAVVLWVLGVGWLPYMGPLCAVALSLFVHWLVISHPARAASRLTKEVLRGSLGGTNLMIMSLRQEQSLSSAMLFASKVGGAFQRELRRCIWEVVMTEHAGFEEAVQRLGERFAPHSTEFKSSMDALVTASCESTQEGQRRALDRANDAMVAGAKRRIEEYALSLSTPSMVMFGLGILLPLMVGSFLPMLSWDLWSAGDGTREAGVPGELRVTFETVFIMNVLFPAVALVVALGTASRHPFVGKHVGSDLKVGWPGLAAVIAATSVGLVASEHLLEGVLEALGLLWSAVAPASLWLAAKGSREGRTGPSERALEGALFRTGARMAEGKNFERAFAESAAEAAGEPRTTLQGLCLAGLMSSGAGPPGDRETRSAATGHNSLEALDVVRRASAKDERAAGILAMDLAAYLKDLDDLVVALSMRLRPIVSMMKVTAYALAPVVLGVTFAMYISLSSIAGAGPDPRSANSFLLVLGVFLAQTNAAVMFFVWGMEGRRDRRELMASIGQSVLCSEMVYSATAIVAAA